MKKVCIIHKVRNLDGRSYYKEARTLAAAGYDVCLMGLFGSVAESAGVRCQGFPPGGSRFGRFVATNARIFFAALKERAQVYHFHDLDFIPWAVLLKLLTGAKVIYDIHEAYPEYMLLKSYIPRGLRHLAALLVYLLEHGTAWIFDAIIPNDNFIAAGFSHRRTLTLFNFPTRDFFHDGPDIPWQERPFDLLYHGSLPSYTFETMLAIAGALRERGVRARWCLVPNDAAAGERARAAAGSRGLLDDFEFLPYADYLGVADYLRRARIGIIPLPAFRKFLKNIPVKMFEFMGAGLPVVLSDLPPSRQFIAGEGCAVAVDASDAGRFAEEIARLLQDNERASAMGGRGRRLVQETYNWEAEGRKLLGLYDELTEGCRACGVSEAEEK